MMYSHILLIIVVQIFHQGQLQYMSPMQFPPMALGMPNIGSAIGAPMSPSMQPGPMAVPMPMPLPLGMPQQKLPVVVMPYYSKSKDRTLKRHRKRRRHRKYASESTSCESSSSDTSSSSDFDFRTSNRHSKGNGKRHQVLTPMVSYITKDGYVVYQKKIKKDRAKDWLQLGKKPKDQISGEIEIQGEFTDKKMKKRFFKKKRHDH